MLTQRYAHLEPGLTTIFVLLLQVLVTGEKR